MVRARHDADHRVAGAFVKKPVEAFITAFKAKNGVGSRNLFGAMIWNALYLVDAGAGPALAKAQPGTP